LFSKVEYHSQKSAVQKLMSVAASLDSLVIGEREIITQVRKAFEKCKEAKLVSDATRILIKHTIETAKKIYTHTKIATKPVSVVALAFQKLKYLGINSKSKVLVIGAGTTNTTMLKFLKKHGIKHFTIFNRTLSNAQKLAQLVNAQCFELNYLGSSTLDFDVIITCTASATSVLNKEIYEKIIGNNKSQKIIVDLSIPNDVEKDIQQFYNVKYIDIEQLKSLANENLNIRKNEIEYCNEIIEEAYKLYSLDVRHRSVELVMSQIPLKIKEINNTAIDVVFAKDLAKLDTQSKEVLNNILKYIEKKYIAEPIKMAKEILVEQ
jgi:glutamyl-tRNA reductase